jgi:hypothetical protein
VPGAGCGTAPRLPPFAGVRWSPAPVSPGIRAHRLRFTARSRYGVGKALAALGAGLGFLVKGSPGDARHPNGVGSWLVLLPRRQVADVCCSPRAWPAWRPPSGPPPPCAIKCWGRRLRGELCGLGAPLFLQPVPGPSLPWVGVARRRAARHPHNWPCWGCRGCSPCFWYGPLPGARLGAEAAWAEGAAWRGGFPEEAKPNEAVDDGGVVGGGAPDPWPLWGAGRRGRDAAGQPRGQKTNPFKRGGRRGCVGARGRMPARLVHTPGQSPAYASQPVRASPARAMRGPRPQWLHGLRAMLAGLLVLGLVALVALARPRGGHPRCTKIPPLYTNQNHSIKVAQPLGWGAASFPEYRIRAETIEPPTGPAGHFGAMMVMKQRGQRHPEASPLQKLLMGFFSRRDGQIGSLRALVVELTPSTPPCSVRLLFSLPGGLFTVHPWRWRQISRNPLRLGSVWGCCRQTAQHVGVFTFVKLPMFALVNHTSARSGMC